MKLTNPKKFLVTWWGSLERGGETAGDLLAVLAVVKELEKANFNYDVASIYHYKELRNIVDWRDVNASDYNVLIFVCGPLIADSQPFQELMRRFSHCRTIAVGVSILPKSSPSYFNLFQITLARDGLDKTYFDIALSQTSDFYNNSKNFREERESSPLIGLCFRGAQREYMNENCLSTKIEDTVDDYIKFNQYNFEYIDTKLNDTCRNPYEIYNLFSKYDVVVTTRLHGALFCIGNCTPFIAIDQIIGGAKLSSLFNKLEYPFVYRGEDINRKKIEEIFNPLLNKENVYEILLRTREVAIHNSIQTLNSFSKIIHEVANE